MHQTELRDNLKTDIIPKAAYCSQHWEILLHTSLIISRFRVTVIAGGRQETKSLRECIAKIGRTWRRLNADSEFRQLFFIDCGRQSESLTVTRIARITDVVSKCYYANLQHN